MAFKRNCRKGSTFSCGKRFPLSCNRLQCRYGAIVRTDTYEGKGDVSMRALFGGRSIKRSIFLSYIIILIIPMLIMGTLGYWRTVAIVKEQTETMYLEKLDQARAAVDKRFLEMNRLVQTLVATRWVQKIVNIYGPTIPENRLEPLEIGGFAEEIRNYESLNGFVDRIAIILNTKRLVLTNNGLDDYEWFFEKNYKYENMGVQDWMPYIESFNHGTVLNPGKVVTYVGSKRAMAYIKTLPIIDQTPTATLLLSIEEKSFQDLLHTGAYDRSSSLYILGENNQVVTGVNIDDHIASLLRRLPGPGERPSDLVTDAEGVEYFTFTTESEVNGWKYVAVIPTAMVLSKVQVLKYAAMLLAALSAAIGLAVSYGFAVRNYRPLKVLVGKFGKLGKPGAGAEGALRPGTDNEYNYLESAFDRMMSSNHELERKVEYYLPMAIHSFFLKLLHQLHTDGEIERAAGTIGIAAGGGWRVAVLYFESGGSGGQPGERKVSRWTVDEEWPLYAVELEDNRLALILGAGARNSMEQALSQVANALKEMYGNRPVFAGIGSGCDRLADVGVSYREGVVALHYAFAQNRAADRLLCFEDIPSDDGFSYYYPSDKEEELLGKLSLGRFDQVEALLEELIANNAGGGRHRFMTQQCFFYSLLSTAMKAMSDAELSIARTFNEREFMELNTIDSMRLYVYDIYKRVCGEMEAKREARRTKVKNEIWAYIDDKCYDSSLSLDSVAERFGLSVPYMSKFIKEQTGFTFVDYVARRRVASAKRLLADPSMTVEEIGIQVGYVNVLTFRRAFKKYAGVTPGEYRTVKRQSEA